MSLKEFFAETAPGAPAFFNRNSTVGDMVEGTITHTEVRQMTEYETGQPRFWENGDPVQQVVITLQTELRDPSIAEDDGQRRVFVKWYGSDRQALLACLKDANADDLLAGGKFTAAFTGLGEQKDRKLNPPKLYTFSYQPPSATAGLIGQAQAAPPAPQPAPHPAIHAVPQPAAAPAAPVAPAPAPVADPAALMAQIKGMVSIGMTDQQIAGATGADAAAIAAIRAIPA